MEIDNELQQLQRRRLNTAFFMWKDKKSQV